MLLFDFGGVLVEFAGPNELGRHLRWPSTPAVILDRWTKCPHTDEFERGQLSPSEWAERFIHDWDVDLRPDVFLATFRTWSRRVLPGARDLLEQLRPHYRLAALSNSNELHWERNANELRVLELVRLIAFASCFSCAPALRRVPAQTLFVFLRIFLS